MRKRAKIRSAAIDELVVRQLRVADLSVTDSLVLPGKECEQPLLAQVDDKVP